jgi:hypothetical protein
VKIILLVIGLAMAGTVIGYRMVLKALAAAGIGVSMFYGMVTGVWFYATGPNYAPQLAGGTMAAAVVGAVAGLMSGRRAGFTAFSLALVVAYTALPLVNLLKA